MLRGATCKAADMAGTAVLRIVVSSDSMKKATATSQGSRRFAASEGADARGLPMTGSGLVMQGQVPRPSRARDAWHVRSDARLTQWFEGSCALTPGLMSPLGRGTAIG